VSVLFGGLFAGFLVTVSVIESTLRSFDASVYTQVREVELVHLDDLATALLPPTMIATAILLVLADQKRRPHPLADADRARPARRGLRHHLVGQRSHQHRAAHLERAGASRGLGERAGPVAARSPRPDHRGRAGVRIAEPDADRPPIGPVALAAD
jgi:hypothetical protein